MNFDWKTYISLIATVAGIVVPIWIWQSEVNDKSISIRQITSAAIAPKELSNVPTLSVVVEGVLVESPYSSILELKNNGRKPILSSDFEEPIEIATNAPVKIVRAMVADHQPKSLMPKLETQPNRILVRPLLLNPGDSFSVLAITSGPTPTFAVSARIAGLPKIALKDEINDSTDIGIRMLNIVAAVTGIFLYFLYGAAISRSGVIRPSRGLALVTMFAIGILSTDTLLDEAIPAAKKLSTISIWLLPLAVALIGGIVGYKFLWSPRPQGSAR